MIDQLVRTSNRGLNGFGRYRGGPKNNGRRSKQREKERQSSNDTAFHRSSSAAARKRRGRYLITSLARWDPKGCAQSALLGPNFR
jgi:hypothetical protein